MRDNFIRANKCVVGETYYLTGMWYDYNIVSMSTPPFITSSNNIPLINTPVIFVGIEKRKHTFVYSDGPTVIRVSGREDFLIEPIENPDILNLEKIKEYLEYEK